MVLDKARVFLSICKEPIRNAELPFPTLRQVLNLPVSATENCRCRGGSWVHISGRLA